MKKHTLLVTSLAAAVLAIAAPARADFYQFTFGGEIHTVDGFVPEPWETVHVGSEFEYTYIFDSEAEDHFGTPQVGLYDLMWAQVMMEGVSQATEKGVIFVINKGLDEYIAYFEDLPIGASGNVGLTGDDDVIDSDDLLLDINLDDWVHGRHFEVIGLDFAIGGHVASFSAQIVPHPGAISLLIYALLRGKRRR